MKRLMLVGPVGCGKTTLLKLLNHEQLCEQKTQAVEVIGSSIDTPGEYLENRRLSHALTVTAAEAEVVALVLSAGSDTAVYAPDQADMFACPVIGIVTKIDRAGPEEIKAAADLLRYAGAEQVFAVSSTNGSGIAGLRSYLQE